MEELDEAVPRNVTMLVTGSEYENAPPETVAAAWSTRLTLEDVSAGVTEVTEGNPEREKSTLTGVEL